MKEKLKAIVKWLNDHYNQESDNYNVFIGSKPDVIKYDEETAIATWACGAIVCIGSLLYFIEEDDGNWFMNDEKRDYATQSCFSIAWANSFAQAMNKLVKYVEKNGKPVYFSGTKTICNYTLIKG